MIGPMKWVVWTLGSVIAGKALLVGLYNPDLWWHLAAGRFIVENGQFLRTDVFSHTYYGAPWINFEWLSQVALYLIYKPFGLWGLYAAKTLLCAAIVFLLWVIARQVGAKGPVLFLLTWVGFKTVQPRLQDRPELATLLFMGLLVCGLLWAREKTAKTQRLPWMVFAVFVLWANAHGGFIYGIGVIALFYLGALLSNEKAAYQRLLLLSLAAAVLGTFVNPYGPKLWKIFWEVYGQLKDARALISEWKATSIQELPFFWALYLVSAAVLVGGFLQGKFKIRFWAPAVLAFAVWSTLFYRNTALLPFVALPFLGSFLRVKKHHWTLWVLVCLPLLIEIKTLRRPFPKEPLVKNTFPIRACDFVRDQNIDGTMFNNYGIGGYIAWALGPTRRLFMDERYLFFPLLKDYQQLSLGAEANQANLWSSYFNEKGVDYAIVNYSDQTYRYPEALAPFGFSSLNFMFPRDTWALVFWDDAGLVFLRRTAAFKEIIKRHEYRSLWPYNLEQMKYVLKQKTVKGTDVQAELLRHRQTVAETIRGQQIENLLKVR